MAEEDFEESEQDETPAQPVDWKIAYEKADRARRRAERKTNFYELKEKYPTVEWEIFEGVDQKKWEPLAARLHQATTKPSEMVVEESPQAPREVSAAEAELTRAAAISGSAATPTVDLPSAQEALQKFKGDDAAYRDYLRQKYPGT